MQEQQLIERVKSRMGDASDAEAARALEATLITLGERMRCVDAAAVADELPPRFAHALMRRSHDPAIELHDVYVRVARREQVPVAFAVEHAQAVCRALAELLSEQARAQMSIDLWPELMRPSLEDRLPPLIRRHGRTLATGRLGSRHPVSEAAPDRAQSQSVVKADNPHASRKVSSGAPAHVTRGDTLASGRPGSKHPVSSARD